MAQALADDLVRFVQVHLGSVWALKLMLTLVQAPERVWTVPELVRELRASEPLITGLLARFVPLGLAIECEPDRWTWRAATPEIQALAEAVNEAYAVTPFGVIQAIAEAPERNIRSLADAFRLRRDR